MYDVVIVGAGIIGLATAHQLKKQRPHLRIALLEKESRIATHQTARNSGVIHSGIYYKPGSLKAKNCLAGRKELLAFCATHGVATQKVGKVIIAGTTKEIPRLEEIARRGSANGVEGGIKLIGPERLNEIEPHAQGIRAIEVPSCQIVDYREVASALEKQLTANGVDILLNQKVEKIEDAAVHTSSRTFATRFCISCAGLFSDRLAKNALGRAKVPHQILPFRGEYYELTPAKRELVRGLIYPVPDPKFPFLGVHLTRMISGSVEAGPNAILALAREGYRKGDIDLGDCLKTLGYSGFWRMALRYWQAGLYEIYRSFSKKAFTAELQKLLPALSEEDLIPAGSGIRAQVVRRNGTLEDDFSIVCEGNQIHVLNAPSPAATASFAIGRHIAELLCTLSL